MSSDEQGLWRCIHLGRSTNMRLQVGEGQVVASTNDDKARSSLWSWSQGPSGEQSIPIDKVTAAFSKFCRRGKEREIFDDRSLTLVGPVPSRTSDHIGQASDNIVFGCCNHRKNICRDGLSAETQGHMETILAMLRGWVDNMGAQAAKKVEAVLWLRGLPDPESDFPFVDVVVLLVDVFYAPKMQYLALCALVGSPADKLEFELPVLPALPCVVTIATRANRVAKKFREVNLVTSDELAYRLASMRLHWVMRPLEYVVDTDSLLQMRLLSAGDALEGKRPVRTRKATPLDEAIFLGDPRVAGAAMASSSSGPAGFPPDDVAADAELYLEGVHDGVPADVLQDILDCDAAVPESAFADMMVGAPHNFEDEADLFDEPEGAEDEEQVAEAEVEEALDDAAGAAAAAQELAIATFTMGVFGYINTDVLPWKVVKNVGRITEWPKDRAEQDRYVSCRCYMHPNCGSPARQRRNVTNNQLVSWLFPSSIFLTRQGSRG